MPTRDALRAVFIAVLLAWQLVMAIPLPIVVPYDEVERMRSARTELDRWHRVVQSLGSDLSRRELVERWNQVTGTLVRARGAVLWPMRPLARHTQTGQGWGVFARPDEWPNRLRIEVREGESWSVFYRRGDLEPTPFGGLLRDRRVRAIYDTVPPSDETRILCTWIAGEVLGARPEAAAVRLIREKTHTRPPTRPPDPHFKEFDLCEVAR